VSDKHFSSQTRGPALIQIADFLGTLLVTCPVYIPAAIKANIIPNLIFVLEEFCTSPEIAGDPADIYMALEAPLDSLIRVIQYSMNHGRESQLSDIADILPLLTYVFSLGNTVTEVLLTVLTGYALRLAPAADIAEWGPFLLREISCLVAEALPTDEHAPVVVESLLDIVQRHPELLVDCHQRGIDESLERLTHHSDVDTAAKAGLLKELLSPIQQDPDVS
jgi:hypothetical protein